MNKPAAIYARVSSDRQKESHTIGSQTSALVEYAQTHGYAVPSEWVFQDEGYSGASLIRPGLEALRDLAAQGQIVAALIYSPDRLSRKYAYQVLLGEEFSRCGVDVIYLKSPSGDSPEDQLVVQFQGMIAEYERAQIAERHRRGKRHRAQQGMVNVLSGAPYGYRYVRKTDTSAAYYEVVESEADVVRMVFATYTQQRFSINAIARLLNERGISTRTGKTRWERSVVWAMLRNPAYEGTACYGKTEQSPRQRITRPLRQKNGIANRTNCHRERPRADWIEVAVPALVSEETFALAQEQLTKNKHDSPRRTIEPTLLQGMLVCQQCGYALYRSSTRTSKRKLYYYRCLGSDAYRHFKGALCTNRPVRSDYLDQFVWDQIIGLLDNGTLIQAEIDRRKEAARNTDPRRQRSETLRREQTRLGNNVARLITAYQEGLVSLAQLRQRMPELNKKSQAVESELQSLETAAVDQARYLQLAESLDGFRSKLRERAKTLDVSERQQILRLLVKEVLVAANSLTIRHSIPIPQTGPVSTGLHLAGSHPSGASQAPSYLLRSRSSHPALRCSPGRLLPTTHPSMPPLVGLFNRRLQPHLDQMQHLPIADAARDAPYELGVRDRIEVLGQISVYHFGVPLIDRAVDFSNRIERTALGTVAIGRLIEVRFENRFEHQRRRGLHYPVSDSGYTERALAHTVGFRNHHSSDRLRFVASCSNLILQCTEPALHPVRLDACEGFPVDARRPAVRTAESVSMGKDVFTPHLVV
jgi:site-specific DNA recombinase